MFENKTVLVTGAGSGVGAAVVKTVAEQGATVWGLDVDRGSAAAIESAGGMFHHCDVASSASWQDISAAASAALPGIDHLHLNAGIQSAPPAAPLSDYRFDALDIDRYRLMMGVNIDGVVLGLHHLLPQMNPGGSIVVTGSLAGIVPYDIDPLYSMTKHAVTGLVRSLAAEMKARDLRINAICPGGVDTNIIPEAQRTDDAVFMTPTHVASEVINLFMSEENGETWAKVSESKPIWIMSPPGRKRKG